MILRPADGGGVLCARLEPNGLRAGIFCLLHNSGRFLRRHDHVDDRGLFRQVEQTAVGSITLNQTLAPIDGIDAVSLRS